MLTNPIIQVTISRVLCCMKGLINSRLVSGVCVCGGGGGAKSPAHIFYAHIKMGSHDTMKR